MATMAVGLDLNEPQQAAWDQFIATMDQRHQQQLSSRQHQWAEGLGTAGISQIGARIQAMDQLKQVEVAYTELAKALTAAQMATIDWMMPMYRY